MRGSKGSTESWPQVIELLINPEVPIMRGSIALDGVLDLKWSRNSLIFSKVSSQEAHCVWRNVRSQVIIVLQTNKSQSTPFIFTKPEYNAPGLPQTFWPEYDGQRYRVTMISSRSYNPSYHIYESICYFVGYLLLLIGSCLSRSYISDKFFSFLNFPSCNLLPYSLLGYLLTRIESRGLLQHSYHITKSCWTKANRVIYQVCLFQGTNAWKTARVSAANAPNKLCVLPK